MIAAVIAALFAVLAWAIVASLGATTIAIVIGVLVLAGGIPTGGFGLARNFGSRRSRTERTRPRRRD